MYRQAGRATKTTETRSLARREHDHARRIAAKKALKYPPVVFTGPQARVVARGFAGYAEQNNLNVWACAIMPDHVHLVTGPFRLSAEQLVIQLKGEATQQLEREEIHPLALYQRPGKRVPQCWARSQWKVYLDPEDVPHAIHYVEQNPIKDGMKPQQWNFVRSG